MCQRILDNSPIVFLSSGSSAPCDKSIGIEDDIDCEEDLQKMLKKYGGITDELLSDLSFMEYYMPIITADMKLLGRYEDHNFVKLQCPLILLERKEDSCKIDNWKWYIEGNFVINDFYGGHFL